MALVVNEVVPKNFGAALEMKRGQRLRIAGKSIVDFVALNLCDGSNRRRLAESMVRKKWRSIACCRIGQKEN